MTASGTGSHLRIVRRMLSRGVSGVGRWETGGARWYREGSRGRRTARSRRGAVVPIALMSIRVAPTCGMGGSDHENASTRGPAEGLEARRTRSWLRDGTAMRAPTPRATAPSCARSVFRPMERGGVARMDNSAIALRRRGPERHFPPVPTTYHLPAPTYQILTRLSGARYSLLPGCTLNAVYQESRLRTVSARNMSGAWPSVAIR